MPPPADDIAELIKHTAPMTKNDLYDILIRAAIEKGYCAIPEFRVDVERGRKKVIDLVWAERRDRTRAMQQEKNTACWKLVAAFEIEGCNFRQRLHEYQRHLEHFPAVRNVDGAPIDKFIVLYTAAYDRAWRHEADRAREVAERLCWPTRNRFTIVDGRQVLQAIAPIAPSAHPLPPLFGA